MIFFDPYKLSCRVLDWELGVEGSSCIQVRMSHILYTLALLNFVTRSVRFEF